MAVYFVAVTDNSDDVKRRLYDFLPAEDVFELDDDKFLVSSDDIYFTGDLAKIIGMCGLDPVASGIVLPAFGYSGRAAPAVSAWLDQRVPKGVFG
jgi:hypothetical protein